MKSDRKEKVGEKSHEKIIIEPPIPISTKLEKENYDNPNGQRNVDKRAPKKSKENEEKRIVQYRTLSDKEPIRLAEENDEYSSMSDEELNRRVEEFIRRFNRQIRLQATRTNQQNLEV
ncbi:hypothetical protein PHJA_002517500 [Phtheirospermum japonicum]|uniref:Uncharacterized protein n=1 Tax=Phtheirospermum japonicum TaxID=374723 RepID=A0A830CWX7_9LAMI|nr:hypothetical protein PHJA_002517500 [Phtheirospermum japonicum]